MYTLGLHLNLDSNPTKQTQESAPKYINFIIAFLKDQPITTKHTHTYTQKDLSVEYQSTTIFYWGYIMHTMGSFMIPIS